jgi:hypothetical protein
MKPTWCTFIQFIKNQEPLKFSSKKRSKYVEALNFYLTELKCITLVSLYWYTMMRGKKNINKRSISRTGRFRGGTRWLGGSVGLHSRWWRRGEQKYIVPLPEIEPPFLGRSARTLVVVLTPTPFTLKPQNTRFSVQYLTLSLLMSYIYMQLLIKSEILTSYIHGPTFGNAESSLFLSAAQCFNTESMQKVFLCHSCV